MEKDYTVVQINSSSKGKISCAKKFATKMQKHPSYLEKKMMYLLDTLNIKYDFQHVIYILTKDNQLDKFYIADFFIRDKNIAIEVDGKFHEMQVEKDNARIMDIQNHYPEIGFIRWKNEDFKSEKSIKLLRTILS